MIPNLETRCLDEWVRAGEAIHSIIGPGDIDVTINGLLWHPKLDLQRACYELCVWQGMGMLCKLELPADSVIHPCIARAALSEVVRHLHSTTARIQVLAPSKKFVYPFGRNKVLTMTEAVEVFDDIHSVLMALHSLDVTHEALHNGIMLDSMGPAGLMWPTVNFCPEYHKLAEWNSELARELVRKKQLFAVLSGSEYIKTWTEAFGASAVQKPWWLSEQLAEVKAIVKPDQNYQLN